MAKAPITVKISKGRGIRPMGGGGSKGTGRGIKLTFKRGSTRG